MTVPLQGGLLKAPPATVSLTVRIPITMTRSYGLQRLASTAACASLILPGLLLAGCGSGGGQAASGAPSGASLPPIDASRGQSASMPPMRSNAPTMQAPPKQGMSTRKKVVLLAGAAALFYLYKKHQKNAQNSAMSQGEPQYYLSKNGRVYYRQANGQAVYVTAPSRPIEVPYEEAQRYSELSGLRGYDNARGGRTLEQLASQGGY